MEDSQNTEDKLMVSFYEPSSYGPVSTNADSSLDFNH